MIQSFGSVHIISSEILSYKSNKSWMIRSDLKMTDLHNNYKCDFMNGCAYLDEMLSYKMK